MFNYLSHPTPTCPLLLILSVPPSTYSPTTHAPPIEIYLIIIHSFKYIPPSNHLLTIHLLTYLSINSLSTPSIDSLQRLPIYPSTHIATSHLSPFHLLSIHPSSHPPPFCLFIHPCHSLISIHLINHLTHPFTSTVFTHSFHQL